MGLGVLKRLLSWVSMLIIGLIVIAFSISNRTLVLLDFWPLPAFQNTPIYIPVIISGFFGFIIGAIVAWFSAGTSRKKARKASRRASSLEKDLSLLQNKIDVLDKKRKYIDAEH